MNDNIVPVNEWVYAYSKSNKDSFNFKEEIISIVPLNEKDPLKYAVLREGKFVFLPPDYKPAVEKGGKWLLFVHVKDVDDIWDKISKATKEGKLGPASKVSIETSSLFSTNPMTRVICVYTSDWKDENDVKRVREELRNLGILNKIPYKTDEDTVQGKYNVKGDTHISKYYE